MVTVTVLYPKREGSHFDHEYYLQKHMSLVRATWESMGLERAELLRGTTKLDGSAPAFELIGLLVFRSPEELQAALGHGGAILADIPNFTNVEPMIQINESVEFWS